MNKRALTLISVSFAMLAGGCERSLIYFPSTGAEQTLERLARSEGLEPWVNEGGDRIGWVARRESDSSDRAAFVVFHGNAGHAAQRAYFAQGVTAATENELSWDVFILEYPGYGSRAGPPSEQSLKKAALAAIDSLTADDYRSLYLAGESLGSGVACHVAATRPVRIDGLLLVTPFTSLQDVARTHYPRFMVSMLLSERYDNEQALRSYAGPVAVLLAERDEVVPAALGRQLYEGYEGPKKLWIQKGRTHNTLSFDPNAPWWRELVAFLTSS